MSIPILWRHLLTQYLRVLLLCTLAFIAVLLVMRLEEIAHFATMGASLVSIFRFVSYQIPYILPIALPISSLVSAILLIQSLSRHFELTALRSCGMALRDILTPILLTAAFLSIGSLYIVSEVATQSHLTAGLLKSELRTVNPLLLLRNKHFMQLKGFYFDILGPSQMGESAADAVLSMPDKHNHRLNVLIAQKLYPSTNTFHGHGVTVLSSLGAQSDEQFDPLVVENIGQATTSIQDFSQILQKKTWTLNNDHLRLPLLMARIAEEKEALTRAESTQAPLHKIKQMQRSINRGISEIIRRISIAIAAFTFTFMGAAFGVSISRYHSNRSIYMVIILTALYLIAYFCAKAMDHVLITASLLYLIPHVLIVTLSCWSLQQAARGVE